MIESGAASSRWEPAQSYPDPAIATLDPRFDDIKPPFNAAVERLATGFRWCEGPVWFGDLRALLWSDIPNNRIMRWDEETGAVSVFRKPSNFSNGNTRDRQGRLVTCEHDSRVFDVSADGTTLGGGRVFVDCGTGIPDGFRCDTDGNLWCGWGGGEGL